MGRDDYNGCSMKELQPREKYNKNFDDSSNGIKSRGLEVIPLLEMLKAFGAFS